MIQLQKHIRDVFEKMLLEAESEVRPLLADRFLYEVSLYDVKTDSSIHQEVDIENTYATEFKRLIPVVIQQISGDFVNLPNVSILEGSMVASMLLPTDEREALTNAIINERFGNVSKTLDKMRELYNGKSIPLGDEFVLTDTSIGIDPTFEATFDFDTPILLNSFRAKLFWSDLENASLFLGVSDPVEPLVNFTISPDSERQLRVVVSLGGSLLAFWDTGFKPQENVVYDIKVTVEQDGVDPDNFNFEVFIDGESFDTETLNIPIQSFQPKNAIETFTFRNHTGGIFELEINNEFLIDDFTFQGAREGFTQIIEPIDLFGVPFGTEGIINFEFTLPNPTTNQFTFENGINYQEFDIELGITVSKDVFNGSQVKYFIDDVEVFPMTRNFGYGAESDTDHKITEGTAKSVNIDNAMTQTFTLYFQPKHKIIELIRKQTKTDLDQNEVHNLKVQYPFFIREYDVIIQSFGTEPTSGNPFTFTIDLVLADDVLLGGD